MVEECRTTLLDVSLQVNTLKMNGNGFQIKEMVML